MPYTAQFFAEKLNVPVDYFNPLRNLQIDPAVNLEELAGVAHSLGEVVGLGLRNLARCPVELNLMPESTLRWQRFSQKKPYFIASLVSLVAVLGAVGVLFGQLADVKREHYARIHSELEVQREKSREFKKAYSDLLKAQGDMNQYVGWIGHRYQWGDVLMEMRSALMRAEEGIKARFGTSGGVWVEQLVTAAPRTGEPVPEVVDQPPASPVGGMDPEARAKFIKRYGLLGSPAASASAPAAPADGATSTSTASNTNEISNFTVTFRASSLSSAGPDANKSVLYSVVDEIKASPVFHEDTKPTGNIGADEPPGTFAFTLNVKLRNPVSL